MYPENNSSNSQTANLSGMLFNHRRFAPWYDDKADYNTDAKSYYDYLARNNKLMDAIISLINELSNEVENLKPENLDDIKQDIINLKDGVLKNVNPLNNLLNQEILTSVPTIAGDGVSFIQGFTFIQSRDELYVIRKNNKTPQDIITRYKYSTMKEIDYRLIPTNSASSFTEGLPYFINGNTNEVNFILRTNYDQIAFIFNYDKNEKSDDFILPGIAKLGMDTNKKYIFSNFGDADHLQGLYLYEFNSVVNMKPKLIKIIRFDQILVNDEKVQGVTIVDNKLVLSHGKQYPKITITTLDGSIINTVSIDKNTVVDMVKKKYPEASIDYNSQYEAEGNGFYIENGKEYPVITHVFKGIKKAYITKVGDIYSDKLGVYEYPMNLKNPVWQKITDFGDTVTPYSTDEYEQPQFSVDKDGFVTLRGFVTYPHRNLDEEWSVMNLRLFSIPFPYLTYTNQFFKTVAGGNPEKTNRIQIKINKDTNKVDVILISTSDKNDKPFCVLDGIRFYTETRGERTPL